MFTVNTSFVWHIRRSSSSSGIYRKALYCGYSGHYRTRSFSQSDKWNYVVSKCKYLFRNRRIHTYLTEIDLG